MSTGSNLTKQFGKWFQIRWAEKLGYPECPYLVRWTLILFGYSIRLHHWLRSDDNRYYHDHSCDLISIIIKGRYYNVMPDKDGKPVHHLATAWKPRRMKAIDRHWLSIPYGGAWTILLCSRPYHKWGFYVNDHLWRPLRYFSKFGIRQTADYQ
jgi:hypothetical protein